MTQDKYPQSPETNPQYLVRKETIQERALRLLTKELEDLCDKLEQGTALSMDRKLNLIQSITSSLAAMSDIHSDDWLARMKELEAEHDKVMAGPDWADELVLPESAQPRHVYHCHERCPAYDGKRCKLLGYQAPCYHSSFPNVCHVWIDAVVEKMGLTEEAQWKD